MSEHDLTLPDRPIFQTQGAPGRALSLLLLLLFSCTNTGMAAGGRIQVNTEHTGISDRSSTRLHAPPGGKQSINIFGGDEEMPAKVQRVVAPAQAVDTGMAAGGRVQVNT